MWATPRCSSVDGSLVYMRNRWYDPNTGRFTQEDPIGYAGGSNLYAYAGNDPVTFSDPFGLEVCYKGSADEINKLKATTEAATNTSVTLDDKNCVDKVTPLSNGRSGFASLQQRFQTLVRSDNVYNVQFGIANTRIGSNVYLAEPFGQKYLTGTGFFCRGGGKRPNTHSLPSLFVHELLGHATQRGFGIGLSLIIEPPANRVENEYHRAVGEEPRCEWDTDRR